LPRSSAPSVLKNASAATTTACVDDGEGLCATIDDDAAESAPTAAATANTETSVSVSLLMRAAYLFAMALPESSAGSRYMLLQDAAVGALAAVLHHALRSHTRRAHDRPGAHIYFFLAARLRPPD
jgi:hypothetical protein